MCRMTERLDNRGDDRELSLDAGQKAEKLRILQNNYFLDWLSQKFPATEAVEELVMLGKIACPVLVTTLLICSKSMISMLFLGRMGKTELAGGSLAIGFANITAFSVMKGLSMAMDPICSQAYGAKRWSVISQTYLKTFLLLLFACIPISILWLNIDHVFHRLGQDRGITRVAKVYLMFSLPELIAHAHLIPLKSFLRIQGLNSPSILATAVSTILHLPICYLFATYLDLRVKGLALSSFLYSLNTNIGLLTYVAFSKVSLKPWVGLTTTNNNGYSIFHTWWPLLCLALPSVLSVCLEWWWYEIILFLGGRLSNPESSVGAVGILIQTTGTFYVFPSSLSVSISQRVGHELGAGEATRAKRAAATGIAVALAFGFVAMALAIGLRSVWGKMYTDDPLTLALIANTLPILGLAEVGNAPQTAACGALMGSARPKLGARINLASFYLIGLPVAVLLTFKLRFGFEGLWWGLVAAQYSCVGMMLHTLFKTDWKYEAKRAEELTLAAGQDDHLHTTLLA